MQNNILENASDSINKGKNQLNTVTSTTESIKNKIMNNTKVDESQINSVKDVVSSALNFGNNAKNIISESLQNPSVQSILSSASALFESAKSLAESIGNSKDSFKEKTSKEKNLKEEKDERLNISKEEAMGYDPNGLKHYINIWLDVMKSEGVSFVQLGSRRWAVDKEDKKIYGNAFLERPSSETYKTLDSDGKLYWLSDYNSRHYYGEAVDIEGDLQGILDKVAKSDKILDIMHKFGICMQIETSDSGHSKGTHFHCSTDSDNPQTKFWGVVNRIRETNKLKLYTVVVLSDYYEKETKNAVILA